MEFDRQQRFLLCQRSSYMKGASYGGVSFMLSFLSVAAYTYFKAMPRMQTKAMLIVMGGTAGLWIGLEKTYVDCQMRMADEMAHMRGLTKGAVEDLYI